MVIRRFHGPVIFSVVSTCRNSAIKRSDEKRGIVGVGGIETVLLDRV